MGIGPINFQGLSSGLDVNGLITAVLKPRQNLIDLQSARQVALAARKSAYGQLGAALSSLRSAALALNDTATIGARTASTSDASIATATAGASAAPGLHTVVVSSLAAASRRRSDGLADATSGLVSDGTITLRAGSGDTITLNVSAASGNNSLTAVRDAVNAAGKGIRASVVNDGISSILVVESEKTGTANALTVTDTTNLNLGAAGGVLQSAANASLTVDGIAVTSSSNTVAGVLDGVSISLLKASPATTVTLTVGRDPAALKSALTDFVNAYNQAADFFGAQAAGGAGKTPPLAGDGTVRSIESLLQGFAVSGVNGLPSTVLRSLGQAGVVLDGKTGRLSLDAAAFNKAFLERPDEFRALLSDSGSSSSGLVKFISAGAATQEGTYAVEVSSAAEQAAVTGGTAVGGQGISAAEVLTIATGGSSLQVSLASGSTLAAIVSAINAALRGAGVQAEADDAGGKLRIRSTGFGSAVSVSAVSDTADAGDGASTGIGTAILTDSGADVAGTINGAAATGSGRTLTGAAGTDVEGLNIEVAGSGSLGTLTFSRGIAARAALQLKSLTDPFSGPLEQAQQSLQTSIDGIKDRIADMQASLTVQQEILLRKFTAMEQTLQALQGTLSSLTGGQSQFLA